MHADEVSVVFRGRFASVEFACAAAGLAMLLAACGGGSGGASAVPIAEATMSPVTPASVPIDDWSTFMHDNFRTGYQAQKTGIDATTASHLTQKWKMSLGESIAASPIVVNGSVFIAGQAGTVAALDVRTGAVLWRTKLAAVRMTPTYADGLLFVGTETIPGVLYALDATTGATRWQASLPGAERGEPAVNAGTVVVGDASGDPPVCNRGGVHAFSEMTGVPIWNWIVATGSVTGGSSWSPISFDGSSYVFGTGNVCTNDNIRTANGVVRLDANGSPLWENPIAMYAASDDDVGSGILVTGNDEIALNKNGSLYDFDKSSGAQKWKTTIGHLDGYGGSSSPGTDGSTIVVGAGYLTDPTKNAVPGGTLVGMNRSGSVLWTKKMSTAYLGGAAIAPGIAFVPIDGSLDGLALGSGSVLWTTALSSSVYSSPALVPSGLYEADMAGDVYAFALPAAATTAASKR